MRTSESGLLSGLASDTGATVVVLGIDTSTAQASVALFRDGTPLATRACAAESRHAEILLPLLDAVFEESGVRKAELTRVGVGVGPGSFTGLRVGIALGLGIGLGQGIPVVGVSSLQALALSDLTPDEALRVAIVDARRGEVFIAAYEADGTLISAPEAILATDVLAHGRALAGSRPYRMVGVAPDSAPSTIGDGSYPHAAAVALLAARTNDLSPPTPDYVRAPDAVKPKLPANPLAAPRS